MPRSVPLWVCFVATVLVFTGAFAGTLWAGLYQAAVSSVADVSNTFETQVMNNLEHHLRSVQDRMILVLNSWSAVPGAGCSDVDAIQSYAYRFVCAEPGPALFFDCKKMH